MMKKMVMAAVLLVSSLLNAQEIEWSEDYKLQLSDFRSEVSQTSGGNIYSIQSGTVIDFMIHMNTLQFMMTKNMNSKVRVVFNPDVASIVAFDEATAQALVNFAQFEFDASELYARKFRKRLYEEKGTFSDIGYAQPIFEQVRKDCAKRVGEASKLTDLGRKADVLQDLHKHLLEELHALDDFCKTCKPKKRK